jgi:hypothetical protein
LTFIGALVPLIPVLAFVVLIFWYVAGREAAVFNAQYNTHWTTGDFFWASDQINKSSQTFRIETK